ncbi:hypothetical protein NG726_01840 [Pseudomonas sp. MOB-449]|nr:hypothetical protein [Pseudomonas sp. MOB-449]
MRTEIPAQEAWCAQRTLRGASSKAATSGKHPCRFAAAADPAESHCRFLPLFIYSSY